ncbi:rhomboid family intramembrane serine protease [Saccharicrinis sp. FJH54]|uniref:rhomboid family intramembrane serine protease n=1 Tax=Saccharicrinis sp. FJH54 TaxID=3344665 RepID=UPI0035D4DC1C
MLKGLGEHIPYERRRFIHSLIIPVVFLLFCWLAKTWEMVTGSSLARLGVYPRELKGLWGILFMPFIHGSIGHIVTNSISFLLLSTGLFYFYRTIALKTFILLFFIANTLLWISGRPSWHIGASGLIYGIGAFLIVSGIIRRHVGLVAVAFIIIFAYGSMFWHIFPLKINDPVSWEGHLMGTLTGIALAIIFRNEGPQRKEWKWEEEEEQEENDEIVAENTSELRKINYIIREEDDDKTN